MLWTCSFSPRSGAKGSITSSAIAWSILRPPWNPMKVEQRIGPHRPPWAEEPVCDDLQSGNAGDRGRGDLLSLPVADRGLRSRKSGPVRKSWGASPVRLRTSPDNLSLTPEEQRERLQQLADTTSSVLIREQQNWRTSKPHFSDLKLPELQDEEGHRRCVELLAIVPGSPQPHQLSLSSRLPLAAGRINSRRQTLKTLRLSQRPAKSS